MAWSVGPRNGRDWSAPSGEILPGKLFGQVVSAVATVGISWTALASLVSNWPETIIDRKVVMAWNNQNIGRYIFCTLQNKIFRTFDVNGQFDKILQMKKKCRKYLRSTSCKNTLPWPGPPKTYFCGAACNLLAILCVFFFSFVKFWWICTETSVWSTFGLRIFLFPNQVVRMFDNFKAEDAIYSLAPSNNCIATANILRSCHLCLAFAQS